MNEIISVGRWAVARDKNGGTLLRFDFTDAPPMTFAIPGEQAGLIANAIRDQYANPPPARLS